MKDEYVLLNRCEIDLILSEISELEHDLREILNKKRWVISDSKECQIHLDLDFIINSPDPHELFEISKLRER